MPSGRSDHHATHKRAALACRWLFFCCASAALCAPLALIGTTTGSIGQGSLAMLRHRSAGETHHANRLQRRHLVFKKLHGYDPSARGVIVLASSGDDVEELKECLTSIHKFYTSEFHTDIIIFYHGSAFEPHRLDVLSSAPDPSRLHLIDATASYASTGGMAEPLLGMPSHTCRQWPFWITSALRWGENLLQPSFLSRGKEARFWSGAAFRHPALDPFDYAWVLQPTARLLAPVGYDVFQYMAHRELTFGYAEFQPEPASYMRGLHTATAAYVAARHLDPVFLRDLPLTERGDWHRFSPAFEIVNLHLLRSLEVQDYFDALDASHGFFAHGWAEGAVRLLQVALFTDYSSMHRFCDFAYSHGQEVHQPSEEEATACKESKRVFDTDPALLAAIHQSKLALVEGKLAGQG